MPAALTALVALAIACHRSPTEAPASSPPAIRRACAVMVDRCSKCHPSDRVDAVQLADQHGWELLVRRMRLQPRSGISLADEHAAVRCIVYRKLGFDTARGRKGAGP